MTNPHLEAHLLSHMAPKVQGIKLFGQKIELNMKEEPIKDNQTGGNQTETNNKKPDKIIPCPRCNSMETKFCYFNNYNVNQPRHFCKACHRYWTAGGALRNVPVGAGRRKSKPAGGFLENCLFDDGMNLAQFELNGMMGFEEWQLAAGGGFRHGFQVKRRRNESSTGQTC